MRGFQVVFIRLRVIFWYIDDNIMTKAENDAVKAPAKKKRTKGFGRGCGNVPVDKRKQLIKYIEMSVKVVGLEPDNIKAFADNSLVVPFTYLRKKFGDIRCVTDAYGLLAREGYPDLMEESVTLRRLTFER